MRAIKCFVLAIAIATVGSNALAQTWPAKPIRVVVPFPPGGGTDSIAREVSNKLSNSMKSTIIIDNKPGSGGNLGIDTAVKAAADGYTLVVGQTSNLAINATLYSKLPYNPETDLTPVGLIGFAPLVIVVAADSPFRTLADVVAAAKAKPDQLNYASAGNGTVGHLATELLQREAGIKLIHVPYKGAAQSLTDVVGGLVNLTVGTVPTMIGQIKKGKLRALAVMSKKRIDDLPQVPTVAESGYKGFEASSWFGILGPARMPAHIVSTLNTELNKALKSQDLRKKLQDQGLDVSTGTPEDFGKLIHSDIEKWGRIVKSSGVKAD